MAGASVVATGRWNSGNLRRGAEQDLNYLQRQANGFSKSVMGSFTGIGASLGAIFAAGAIVDFFKESAQAAMEDQKSMVALAKAMDNVGLSAQNAKAESLIQSMSMQVGIADDELRPAYQKLVTVTKDVGEAQGLLRTALDLSAAGYGNLESATKALSAAANGNFTALQRLKVPIDQNIIASKDFDAAVQALNRTVGGQAAAAANTYAGQMARISVAAGEAKEAIGYALLNAMNNTASAITSTGGIQQALLGLGNYMATVITDVGYLTTALATASTYYKQAASDIGLPSKAMEILVGIITHALLPGLAQAGLAVKNLGIIWNAMPEWMKTAAGALLGWSGVTTVASASAKMLSGDANKLSLEHEHLARAATNAQPALAGMADGLDEVAGAADGATQSLAGTILAANAMALSHEHNARAEMAGKGPSLDLLRVLLPMREAMDNVGRAGGGAASGVDKLTKAQEAAQQRAQKLAQDVDSLATSLQGLATDVAGGPVIDLLHPTFEAINSLVDKFKSSLSDARNYAQGIVDGFMGQLDLGKALDDAKASGGSIVEAFVKQGDKVMEFGRKMNALLKAGLSKAAFDDIMKLGYERGTEVANALSDGNVAGNIASVNKVYSSVKTMAEEIADAAAKAFYDAGLKVMESMIYAMVEGLGIGGKQRKRLMEVMDSLAASMNRTASIYVGITGPGAGMAGVPVPVSSLTPTEASDLIDGILNSGGTPVPMFADGGIATSPTLGVFGDAGPEALIPLDRMGSMGNTYSITVQAGVGDPRAIGKSVVEAITLFERSSGPVFARA